MYVKVKNENYGYAVATYGDYVVVSNPAVIRYDNILLPTVYHTGSVDYFRYNKNTDEHDYVGTLYKSWVDIEVLLTTELLGSVKVTASFNTEDSQYGILIDKDMYTASVEDGYGLSLDMYNKQLVVGNPYWIEHVHTDAKTIYLTGSSVDIYDLNRSEYTSLNTDPYIYTINDPDVLLPEGLTGSFGQAVSINKDWIAVGSPFVSESNGMIYMYRNNSTGNTYNWSLYQKLEPIDPIPNLQFGYSLKLNKCDGSRSASMVVGCNNSSSNEVYYFEFTNSHWTQSYVFRPDYTIQPMTFADYMPYEPIMNTTNSFGRSVSLYGNAVIIGENYDRKFYEYSGSALYQQGSVYIFERCLNQPYTLFEQVFKTYGTPLTLKSNRAGFSVDMFGNNAVAGIPKITDCDSCDIQGSLDQLHYCNADLQSLLHGQAMLIQKNTSSNDWEITNVYQKKKRFLSPYRTYGYDVAIADRSMVVGSPMYLIDDNREITINLTQSNGIYLDDVAGKAYIYNLKNLRDKFHVGNVFYRNGKIVIMTSGSTYESLFYNPINTYTYEYDLQFKGQHTIFEKQVVCSVNPGEFNISTNPTAIITTTSSLDINKNGKFDYQDLDVIMRYMQYKNTSILGVPVSTNWSSSIVIADDEKSLLKYYQDNTDNSNTSLLTTQSIEKWETTDTWMQNTLDLNEDNKIDVRDMNIMWKYFTSRLSQENYASYITPSCHRKLFSDIIDYMNGLSQRTARPLINPAFTDYEYNVSVDKTGSFLAPYVTTIGLYSGLDLVCVAKLGSPIKITPELPYNFVVKMDY